MRDVPQRLALARYAQAGLSAPTLMLRAPSPLMVAPRPLAGRAQLDGIPSNLGRTIGAGQPASASTRSAPFSPTMIAGALVLPEVTAGKIEASMTRMLSSPWTRSRESTTH
jgi:phage terminase large subunit-like protein